MAKLVYSSILNRARTFHRCENCRLGKGIVRRKVMEERVAIEDGMSLCFECWRMQERGNPRCQAVASAAAIKA